MSHIKVTVEYEKPMTDKFFELMNSYNELKKQSDEVVSYYTPLAEMAEEAKFDAICEQLEIIKEYVRQLRAISKGDVCIQVETRNGCVTVDMYPNNEVRAFWIHCPFEKEEFKKFRNRFNGSIHDNYNILGNWDKWRIYERLEKSCYEKLEEEMMRQKQLAEAAKKRLENITG